MTGENELQGHQRRLAFLVKQMAGHPGDPEIASVACEHMIEEACAGKRTAERMLDEREQAAAAPPPLPPTPKPEPKPEPQSGGDLEIPF